MTSIREDLERFFKTHKILTKNDELFIKVLEETSEWRGFLTPTSRAKLLMEGKSPTLCKKCGNFTSYNRKNESGFNEYCSVKCSSASEEKKQKIRKTLAEHTQHEKEQKQQKYRRTCLSKYGVDNVSKSTEIKSKIISQRAKVDEDRASEKRKITNLERYGVDNVSSVAEFNEKREQTNINRYGTKNTFSNLEIKEKIRKTNLEKYGTEYPSQSPVIREKIRKTNLEKYGVDHFSKTDEFKVKYNNTAISRYNTNHPMKCDEIKRKSVSNRSRVVKDSFFKILQEFRYRKKYETTFFNEEWVRKMTDRPLSEILTEAGVTWVTFNKIRKLFDLDIKFGTNKSSDLEDIVEMLLKTNNIKYIKNDRKMIGPKELDFYLYENNVAIECHGEYWHSSKYKTKNEHLIKSEICDKNNIELLQFHGGEIKNKTSIVESIILAKTNRIRNKIYARDCKVVNLSRDVYRLFCEENHIQGWAPASVMLGLVCKDELISVMSFAKSRYDLSVQWEMIRFCSKVKTSVVGGASRLFKNFIKDFSGSIITYSDRRISKGSLYKILGFAYSHKTQPSYKYLIGDVLVSRISYQKHKLEEKLKIYDDLLSEEENMIANGHYRLYDSGNMAWKYTAE